MPGLVQRLPGTFDSKHATWQMLGQSLLRPSNAVGVAETQTQRLSISAALATTLFDIQRIYIYTSYIIASCYIIMYPDGFSWNYDVYGHPFHF